MTSEVVGSETPLQCALRLLAESQALLSRNCAELAMLRQSGHSVREVLAINAELREKVAQGQRNVIRAQDRIRFGLDEADVAFAVVSELSGTTGCMQSDTDTRATPGSRKEDCNAAIKGRSRQAA